MIAVALVAASLVMGFVLQRFVTGQVDQRLDAQAIAIRSALRLSPEGRLEAASDIDPPPFNRPGAPWIWQVEGPDGIELSSRSLRPGTQVTILSDVLPPRRPPPFRRPRSEMAPVPADDPPGPDLPPQGTSLPQATSGDMGNVENPEPDMAGSDAPRPGERRNPAIGRARVIEAASANGRPLHGRRIGADVGGRLVAITVLAPAEAINGPMRQAMTPLFISMLVLGLVLGGATYLQVRLGLKPLRRLGADLSAVRRGAARHVPLDQPNEIRPLAEELNSLIDENAQGLERARRHVANLAHGLKTPLADLALTLRQEGRDPDGSLEALVSGMDRQVRHHLARARAAAIDGAMRAATPLAEHVRDLESVLSRIHDGRGLAISAAIPAEIKVAVEPQDLDEMIGNLLDNACKWARSRIAVTAERDDASGMVRLSIEDDGFGIADGAVPEALLPGRRLDEVAPGHGFGLSITRELAELYGGRIEIARSPAGGVAAILTLPMPRGG